MPDPTAQPLPPGPCQRCIPVQRLTDFTAEPDDAALGRQIKLIWMTGRDAFCFEDGGEKWVRQLDKPGP